MPFRRDRVLLRFIASTCRLQSSASLRFPASQKKDRSSIGIDICWKSYALKQSVKRIVSDSQVSTQQSSPLRMNLIQQQRLTLISPGSLHKTLRPMRRCMRPSARMLQYQTSGRSLLIGISSPPWFLLDLAILTHSWVSISSARWTSSCQFSEERSLESDMSIDLRIHMDTFSTLPGF